MADYFYTREIVNGKYNINNPEHTEGTGNPVSLPTEIGAEPTLPDLLKMKCDYGVCILTFSNDLSDAQKRTLDDIVAYQKTDT